MLTDSDRDCGNQTCSLHFQNLPTCHFYFKGGLECNPPCNYQSCEVVVKHFVDCPVWICNDKVSTTTLLPPTTTSNIAPPIPHGAESCQGIVCITSVVLNVLILLTVLILLAVYLKRKRNQPVDSEQGNDELTPFLSNFVNPSFSQNVSEPERVHFGAIRKTTGGSSATESGSGFCEIDLHSNPSAPRARLIYEQETAF